MFCTNGYSEVRWELAITVRLKSQEGRSFGSISWPRWTVELQQMGGTPPTLEMPTPLGVWVDKAPLEYQLSFGYVAECEGGTNPTTQNYRRSRLVATRLGRTAAHRVVTRGGLVGSVALRRSVTIAVAGGVGVRFGINHYPTVAPQLTDDHGLDVSHPRSGTATTTNRVVTGGAQAGTVGTTEIGTENDVADEILGVTTNEAGPDDARTVAGCGKQTSLTPMVSWAPRVGFMSYGSIFGTGCWSGGC